MKYLILLFFSFSLFARPIETFYGTLEVEEPILLELIDSPTFQRLKKLRQYGLSYYIGDRCEYTRYDHSLGVFAILRLKGFTIEEQIQGLLHDVSHTAFSHVGEYLFGMQGSRDSYRDMIHYWFLEHSEVQEIVKKYGLTLDQINPKGKSPLVLSVDRIDYNLQGACYRSLLSLQEAIETLESLEFIDGAWISQRPDLMEMATSFSIFTRQNHWTTSLASNPFMWFAEAVRQALDIGALTMSEIHWGTDDEIWGQLHKIEDPFIQQRLFQIHCTDFFTRSCK